MYGFCKLRNNKIAPNQSERLAWLVETLPKFNGSGVVYCLTVQDNEWVAGRVPVFVLDHPTMPEGNISLLKMGALSFPYPFREHPLQLKEWLDSQAARVKPDPLQPSLF